MQKSIINRFESKFTPEPNTGCWLWLDAPNWKGYGQLKVNGVTHRAHRLSYQIYVGEIPAKMHVLHKCDTPSCVNPDHLYIGTNADNVGDKVKRGRCARFPGESNGRSKLTTDDIKAIREDTRKQSVIADDYGVSHGHIWRIKNNLAWKI